MEANAQIILELGRTVSTIFKDAFGKPEVQYEKVAMTVPSSGRSNYYPWLLPLPMMRKWVGDRVVNLLEGKGYELVNDPFESTIGIKGAHIADDNLGIYSSRIAQMGENARLHPEYKTAQLLLNGFSQLCWDGQPFFDTDHPVGDGVVSNSGGGSGTGWYLLCTKRATKPLIYQERTKPELIPHDDPKVHDAPWRRDVYEFGVNYRAAFGYGMWQFAFGSKATLDADSYEVARVAMMSQKDLEGNPLGIVPDTLVVPPSLERAGKKILVNEKTDSGADNEMQGTADLMVWTWLV